MSRILVVDDEPDLREILEVNLTAAGYAVDTASSAEEALDCLGASYDLLLLDVMLGGMSGFRLAEKLRRERGSRVPIIFLTARDTENDLLTGFAAGADDYIAKPFSLQELQARIRAVLGRTAMPEEAVLRCDDLVIHPDSKTVEIDGRRLALPPKEFGILSLLAHAPGRVFSREEILRAVWQGESCVLDRTVDVHIARLRRKLGAAGERLVNRQGYGYCFN